MKFGFYYYCVFPLLFLMSCKKEPFPAPSGIFPVGKTELFYTDSSRTNPFHQKELRQISLQIWYPSLFNQKPFAPLLSKELLTALSSQYDIPIFFLGKEIPSSSRRNAPPRDKDKYPLLLFNHEFAGFPEQNSALVQELASQGYVVISLGHPGESIFLNTPNPSFLDSTLLKQIKQPIVLLENNLDSIYLGLKNSSTPLDFQNFSNQLANSGYFPYAKEAIERWSADTEFILNTLQEQELWDKSNPLLAIIDFDNIALIGHGLGGSVATEMNKRSPSWLKASVHLSALPLDYVPDWRPLHKPALFLESQQPKYTSAKFSSKGTYAALLKNSKPGGANCLIYKSTPANFTDLNFAGNLNFLPDELGQISPHKMGQYLNQILLTYLNPLLKQNQESNKDLPQFSLSHNSEFDCQFYQ